MKVLSIKEPWASLIVNGYKEYEFRTWNTKYRGEFLIHACKSFDKDLIKRFDKYHLNYNPGYIIGKAEIVDCIKVTKDLENKLIEKNEDVYGIIKGRNCYAFKLSNVSFLDKPIRVNGKLGLWNYEI